jgi:hypothetical protein
MIQYESCKRCTNRKISRTEGILCGLTDVKPDFEEDCPSFDPDDIQISRLKRFEKTHNPEEVNKESIYRYLSTGIPLFAVGFAILIVPALNFGSGFVMVMSIIAALAGLGLIIISIMKASSNVSNHKMAEKKPGSLKEDEPENASEDLEIY